MHSYKAGTRTNRGSILALTVVVVMVVVALGTISLLIFAIFKETQFGQSEAERRALTAARMLNISGRESRMNHLVRDARELVYSSRKTEQKLTRDYPIFRELAAELTAEARAGAQKLEQQRQLLAQETAGSVSRLIRDGQTPSTFHAMVGLQVESPQVESCDLGFIAGTTSDVRPSDGVPDLAAQDNAAGYVDQSRHLYRGNIDARLPAPDGDLTFKLAPLEAATSGAQQSARLSPAASFIAIVTAPDMQLPSSVRLQLRIPVKDSSGARQALSVVSAASTGGVTLAQ